MDVTADVPCMRTVTRLHELHSWKKTKKKKKKASMLDLPLIFWGSCWVHQSVHMKHAHYIHFNLR
jgi:hypothetical protein